MSAGRLLGVDFGDVRLGFALSDPDRIIAAPLKVTTYKGTDKRAAHLVRETAEETGAAGIVVGMPYSLNGTAGPKAQQVTAFVDYLKTIVDLPVVTFDERLSSVEAERSMRQTGARTRKIRGKVDMVAASLILQSFLDSGGSV